MIMRTGDDEQRAPKYAHIERERRWLVHPHERPGLSHARCVLIEDRYIAGTRMRLRRMTDAAAGLVSLKLTKKYEAGDPLAQPIVTAYLTEAEYALLSRLPANSLVKRRYHQDETGVSIDLFEGPLAGLELAEIECASHSELIAVGHPAWAICEVTGDARYQGFNLAALDAKSSVELLARLG